MSLFPSDIEHVVGQIVFLAEFVVSMMVTVPPPVPAMVTVRSLFAILYIGASPGVGVARIGVAVGSGRTGAPSAFRTLMRPNGAPLKGSVAPRIWSDTSRFVLPWALSKAARPAACADAAEVPLTVPYFPPARVV